MDDNALDSANVGEELNSKPCLGMEFKSIEEVKEFYNSFAKNMGFGVRVRSTKPKRAILVYEAPTQLKYGVSPCRTRFGHRHLYDTRTTLIRHVLDNFPKLKALKLF
jgi:hypothetical protein